MANNRGLLPNVDPPPTIKGAEGMKMNQAPPPAISGGFQMDGQRSGPTSAERGTKKPKVTKRNIPAPRQGLKPGEIKSLAELNTLSQNRSVRKV